MANVQEFRPDWVSAPGDTIADILRERSLSDDEFARLIGETPEGTRNLLQGRSTITLEIARRLEYCLGASVEFWMSRDFQYRQDIARIPATHKEWLNELPIGDMIKFRWLTPVPHPKDEVAACLDFFGVPSVQAWHKLYAGLQHMTAFRTSPSFDSRPAAVAAWLRQGEIEAEAINCRSWDAAHFRDSLVRVRSLTRYKDPGRFIPALQEHCADCGVAVVIVRAPSGCRASGATRFLARDKALLQLSFRYLTDDHFWFTFFHESGHLLLHKRDGVFLEGVAVTSSTEEEEANEFAARTLIPPEFLPELMKLSADAQRVIRFAVKIGISPGIIVGQLQHLGRLKRNQLNRLKRRFSWE